MSKTEYAWVIQRDDGKFFDNFNIYGNADFCDSCVMSFYNTYSFFDFKVATKEMCETAIKTHNLQNCKPVKVKIEIVGE